MLFRAENENVSTRERVLVSSLGRRHIPGLLFVTFFSHCSNLLSIVLFCKRDVYNPFKVYIYDNIHPIQSQFLLSNAIIISL
jgi:hypothetical protein